MVGEREREVQRGERGDRKAGVGVRKRRSEEGMEREREKRGEMKVT